MALYDAIEVTVISTVILVIEYKRELINQIAGTVRMIESEVHVVVKWEKELT